MLVGLAACGGPQVGDTEDTGDSPDPVDTAGSGGADRGGGLPFQGRLGRSWRFDLTSFRIPEAADAGDLLRSLLGSHLLVPVVGEDAAGMTLRLFRFDGLTGVDVSPLDLEVP